MVSSHQRNLGKNHDIKMGNKSFETLANFKHLPTKLKNLNCIHEQIRSILNFKNACYRSVQYLLSCLLSEDINIKTQKIKSLPGDLYGCETWSLRSGEELRLNARQ